jgi:hypothetical protein
MTTTDMAKPPARVPGATICTEDDWPSHPESLLPAWQAWTTGGLDVAVMLPPALQSVAG